MQYRSLTESPVEVRDDGGRRVLTGYAIVFNSMSCDLGGYRERVSPSAVDDALRDIRDGKMDVQARIQHRGGLDLIGRIGNGTLSLEKDSKGVAYRIYLPNTTSADNIYELVKGQYITKSSFAFSLRGSNGAEWDYSTSPPTRTLRSINIHDVSPVDSPAYEETMAECRATAADVLAEMRAGMDDTDAGPRIEIKMLGEIGPTWMSRYMPDIVSSGKVMEALAAVPDAQSIEVYINSPGGDVFEAHAIYNALKEHPAPVNVHVRGLAASAASVIAMAGDTITMGQGAFIMIHNAWTIAMGNAGQLRDQAVLLDKIDGAMSGIYSARTGGDEKQIRKQMAAETWLTADEAVAGGFATGKTGETAPIDGQRCRELQYRNVPRELGGPCGIEERAIVTPDDVLEISARELKRVI